jgi:ribulose-phosphate 3-epimerase
MSGEIEVVPAILRTTFEGIAEDWNKVCEAAAHIQIDITDGIFAGDGTFREVRRFKQLPQHHKCELHLMVHTPAHFVGDVIDLSPARCIFHIESFTGTGDLASVYGKLRAETQAQLALAINPDSPTDWLVEQLGLVDFVLFMGYNPGWANQPINEKVYRKIAAFHERHPEFPIAVDGHVDRSTVEPYVKAGASILCANTSIFRQGSPIENMAQLSLLAEAAKSG